MHKTRAFAICTPRAQERGGTFLGLILGILIGLFAALVVAVYVTKVPIPFSPTSRTIEGSVEEEIQKNKNWDPNGALGTGNIGLGKTVEIPEHTATPEAEPSHTADTAAETVRATKTPKPRPQVEATESPNTSDNDDPLADLVKRKTSVQQGDVSTDELAAKADPFIYYVQIGAFANRDQAEGQKAQAAMAGFSAEISERDQAGRLVHRVRLGPFDNKEAADTAKARLASAGIQGALVRIQR